MKQLLCYISAIALIIGCVHKEQFELAVDTSSNRKDVNDLCDKLEHEFAHVLSSDSIEVLTLDDYLLQCWLAHGDFGKATNGYIIRWGFLNLNNVEFNPRPNSIYDLDSTKVLTSDPHNLKSYLQPFMQSFLKQLIKRKIVRLKHKQAIEPKRSMA
jgi:hypothetical protein